MRDHVGYDANGSTGDSLSTLERGLHEFRCYIGDPAATVEKALQESPRLVMGHVLKSYLYLTGTEPAGLPIARATLENAESLAANDVLN